MSTLILAIDFGTTTTVVCGDIENAGNPSFIKDEQEELIPSLIYIDENRRCWYGKNAFLRYNSKKKGKLIDNFKMGLISEDSSEVEESKAYIEDFLKNHIYKLFEQQKTDLPKHDRIIVRISYPVKWPSELRDFMHNAVKNAGFEYEIEEVEEPLAISTYSLQAYQRKLSINNCLEYGKVYTALICDMGGGTTDIVICKLKFDEKGKCVIIDSEAYPKELGKDSCGGSEIDKILSRYIQEKCGIQEDIFSNREAKLWKEQYVSEDLKNGEIAEAPQLIIQIFSFFGKKDKVEAGKISREIFESISKDHWKIFSELVESSIKDYYEKNNLIDLDFVFLTGGHSQWYCVEDKLTEIPIGMKRIKQERNRIIHCPNANETVARGLCSYNKGLLVRHYFNDVIKGYLTLSGRFVNNKKNDKAVVVINILEERVELPYIRAFNYSYDLKNLASDGKSYAIEELECTLNINVGERTIMQFKSEKFTRKRTEVLEYKIEINLQTKVNDNGEVNVICNWKEPFWAKEVTIKERLSDFLDLFIPRKDGDGDWVNDTFPDF